MRRGGRKGAFGSLAHVCAHIPQVCNCTVRAPNVLQPVPILPSFFLWTEGYKHTTDCQTHNRTTSQSRRWQLSASFPPPRFAPISALEVPTDPLPPPCSLQPHHKRPSLQQNHHLEIDSHWLVNSVLRLAAVKSGNQPQIPLCALMRKVSPPLPFRQQAGKGARPPRLRLAAPPHRRWASQGSQLQPPSWGVSPLRGTPFSPSCSSCFLQEAVVPA